MASTWCSIAVMVLALFFLYRESLASSSTPSNNVNPANPINPVPNIVMASGEDTSTVTMQTSTAGSTDNRTTVSSATNIKQKPNTASKGINHLGLSVIFLFISLLL